MRIVGIDLSLSRTGVCALEEKKDPLFISIRSDRSANIFKRQKAIVKQIRGVLREDDIVVFEDFALSEKNAPSGKFIERIELCGMLKLVVPSVTNLPWLSALAPMMKSFIIGVGDATNDALVETIRTQWGANPSNDDEAGAFGLARYARSVLFNEEIHEKKNQKFVAYGQNFTHLTKIRFVMPRLLDLN